MVKWLRMKCTVNYLEVTGSNPGRVERGVSRPSTSV